VSSCIAQGPPSSQLSDSARGRWVSRTQGVLRSCVPRGERYRSSRSAHVLPAAVERIAALPGVSRRSVRFIPLQMSAAVKVFPSRAASRPPLEKSNAGYDAFTPDILNRCSSLYTRRIFPGATAAGATVVVSPTPCATYLFGPAEDRLGNAQAARPSILSVVDIASIAATFASSTAEGSRATLLSPRFARGRVELCARDWVVRASGDPLPLLLRFVLDAGSGSGSPYRVCAALEQVETLSVAPRVHLSLFGLFRGRLAFGLAAVGI